MAERVDRPGRARVTIPYLLVGGLFAAGVSAAVLQPRAVAHTVLTASASPTSAPAAVTVPGRARDRLAEADKRPAPPVAAVLASSPGTIPPSTTTTAAPPAPDPSAPAASTPAPVPAPAAAGPAVGTAGVWGGVSAARPDGSHAVEVTHFAYGNTEAGLARIDTSLSRVVLYAGNGEPSGSWTHVGGVSSSDQGGLLAAFNAGFKIADYQTGWMADGKVAMPLQTGKASLVIDSDGHATVGQWGRDVGPGANVSAVRQNLNLLVDGGAPVAAASDVNQWGATLGGVTYVWRSGIGVDSAGRLVYAAAPGISPADLAGILIKGGVVRGMELDINPEWADFSWFDHPSGPGTTPVSGTNLLSNMYYAPSHFLNGFNRDFFAVFAR